MFETREKGKISIGTTEKMLKKNEKCWKETKKWKKVPNFENKKIKNRKKLSFQILQNKTKIYL